MAQRYFSSTMFEGASQERANYARLLCLLVEQGTECMKNYVLNNLPPLDQLERSSDHEEMESLLSHKPSFNQALIDNKKAFDDLKQKKKITIDVYSQLFPSSGVPVNTDSLDMTCWYTLARNLAVNRPKVNYGHFQVNPPKPKHRQPQHNIIRIRNMRNTLFHLDSANLETATFEIMWKDLTLALTSLGTPGSVIDNYKTRDLDPLTTMTHYMRIREQVHLELESVYNWEIKRKKYLITSLGILGILLVTVALASNCITYFYARTWSSCIHSMQTHLTDAGAISVIPREGWGAKPSKAYNPPLKTPLPYAIISHTAVTGRCATTDDCCNTAQVAQRISFYKKFDDVAFNYMVGNDGVIYEGRVLQESAGAWGWNDKSITIGFLGKYVTSPPTDDATDVAKIFLQYLVDNNVLHHNFTLYGLCQVRPFPDAPGAALYKIIKTWHGEGPNNTWSWRPHKNESCRSDVKNLTG